MDRGLTTVKCMLHNTLNIEVFIEFEFFRMFEDEGNRITFLLLFVDCLPVRHVSESCVTRSSSGSVMSIDPAHLQRLRRSKGHRSDRKKVIQRLKVKQRPQLQKYRIKQAQPWQSRGRRM